MQLNFLDVRLSRLPQVLGLCSSNIPEIAAALNEVTQRLLYAGGDTGWVGCWRRVSFLVNRDNPYITLPPKFARIINLTAGRFPFRIQNAFYELLPGSVGVRSPECLLDWCGNVAGYERNTTPVTTDLTATNQYIRAYLTDTRDVGSRVLVSGKDQNGNEIWTQDAANNVNGVYLALAQPYVTTSFIITELSSIQKDLTYGDVLLKQVDATTGDEVLLARYGPREINPNYRRYYISRLPINCCSSADGNATIEAICKMEIQPMYIDTDQLIISNLPALIEEAQALRYSQMDTPTAAGLEEKHHKKAIRLLQQEQTHVEGEADLAVSVNSFEGECMRQNRIGILT